MRGNIETFDFLSCPYNLIPLAAGQQEGMKWVSNIQALASPHCATTVTQHSHSVPPESGKKANHTMGRSFLLRKPRAQDNDPGGQAGWSGSGGQWVALMTLCTQSLHSDCCGGSMSLTLWLCVCPAVMKKWQQRGGQPWQLIEPVDGFHPNEVSALTWWLLNTTR